MRRLILAVCLAAGTTLPAAADGQCGTFHYGDYWVDIKSDPMTLNGRPCHSSLDGKYLVLDCYEAPYARIELIDSGINSGAWLEVPHKKLKGRLELGCVPMRLPDIPGSCVLDGNEKFFVPDTIICD